MTELPPASAPAPAKPSLGQRLKAMFEEYGSLAITIYFVIFALVFLASGAAIYFGMEIEGATQGAGLAAGAWLATKLTQPFRILATLALTPIVAKFRNRKPKQS